MSYIIMPRCSCSRCLRNSSSNSRSRRHEKDTYKCNKNSREKSRSCSCNKCKCKCRLSPKYNCDDSGDDETSSKSICSCHSHQFIITIKNNN